MKRIHKYFLQITDYQTLELPEKSQILTLQVQDGTPTIWVLETGVEFEDRHIRMAETGHLIKEDIVSYIGTFQTENPKTLNEYVGHVFEIKGKTAEDID